MNSATSSGRRPATGPDFPAQLIRRGSQSRVSPKAAIIGGGKACEDLLTFLADGRLARLDMEILGVADPNPDAPGMVRARAMGIFTTPDFTQLYPLPGLNLLIELTGSTEVRERMIRTKPLQISSIDHRGARLLWDLIQIEAEKRQLQEEGEEALRAERDWFQKLMDSLPDSIMLLDMNCRVQGVNRTLLHELDLTKEEVMGRTCYELSHSLPEKCPKEQYLCPFDEVIRTGRNCSVIHVHYHADKTPRFEEVTAAPIRNDAGEIVQVIQGIRDVTRRITLERELKESEQKLRQFLETTHDIICIKDLDGRYQYINPAGAQTMGLRPEQVIGKTDLVFFPRRIAGVMRARDREAVEQNKTLGTKERMRTEGRTRHFHTVRFPILSDDGKPEAVCVVARDMTDEVLLQEEVRKNEEYLESVLNNSSDMTITTDSRGCVVTFNPAAERILGYTRDEILGTHVERLWETPWERRKLMEEVSRRGAVNNFPAVLIAKDGRKVEISLSLSQLRDKQGRVLGTVGISKDVTEENRMRRQLLEQERLAAIGQTVAGMAHCIKNILNGLKGGSYILNTGLKRADSAMIQEGWENVQNGIARIGRLSLDMLSYCRDRNPVMEPVNPLKLVRDTVELVSKSAAQEGIQIAIHGDGEGPVPLDPDMVGRALLNIVFNAVDACREKTYGDKETPRVDVSVRRSGAECAFVVRDNGVGMDEEVRSQLFKRFFSTKAGKGTGIGLCVTHKLIDDHGGRIDVESVPGAGSTFTIVIPATPGQASMGSAA